MQNYFLKEVGGIKQHRKRLTKLAPSDQSLYQTDLSESVEKYSNQLTNIEEEGMMDNLTRHRSFNSPTPLLNPEGNYSKTPDENMMTTPQPTVLDKMAMLETEILLMSHRKSDL